MTASTDTTTRTLPATVQDVVSSEDVQSEINARALDAKDRDRLRALAVAAIQEAIDKAQDVDEQPTDHELQDIAVRAIVRASANYDVPLIPEISPERGAELTVAQHTASAIDQAVMDAEDVHRALGRIEGMEFLRRVGDVAVAQVFTEMRNSKKYKGLPYHDGNGNLRHVEDFEEFCKVKLGKSYTRCYELSKNLAVLGSDLYESAERIGFRSRDYRALKALPAEDQAVVKQALESETKDEVLDILQDLAAKHQAEREAARKERDDLSADLEARGKLLEDKAARLEKTEEELYKLKSLPKDADLELKLAREQEAVKELGNAYMTALVGLNALVVQAEAVLSSRDISAHTSQYVVSTIGDYCRAVNAALLKHEIPVDFEEEVSPAWMRETAQADLEAGQTNTPDGRDW